MLYMAHRTLNIFLYGTGSAQIDYLYTVNMQQSLITFSTFNKLN